MQTRLLALLAACLLLTGCPRPSDGIGHRLLLSRAPDPACITRALGVVPGIGEVRHQVDVGGRRITWRGLAPPDTVHRFVYSLDAVGQSNLYFEVSGDDARVNLYNSYNCDRCGRDAVLAHRPTLRAIEAAIAPCGPATSTLRTWDECAGAGCQLP